jgi:hypothetical protein
MSIQGEGGCVKFGSYTYGLDYGEGKSYSLVNDLPEIEPIKCTVGCYFEPESLLLEKFDSSPHEWIVTGGDKYKTLKKRQCKRANKTKMSHRKRKRMYIKPFKHVLDGFVNTITMVGNTATIIIKQKD